jgi:hypothetical protein
MGFTIKVNTATYAVPNVGSTFLSKGFCVAIVVITAIGRLPQFDHVVAYAREERLLALHISS